MIRWVFTFLFSFSATAAEKGQIELKSDLTVSEARMLTLADIAEFKNIDEGYIQKIKAVTLGKAPQVGEQHSYTSVFLSSTLRKALKDIPSEIKDVWSIRIPSKILVKNQGHRLSSEAVEEKLSSRWKSLCGECRFLIVNLMTPQIPKNLEHLPWELKTNDTLPRGQFTVPLEVRDEGGQPHLFWVRGQVQIRQEIPVTTRAINFGERLSKTDFELQWKDVTYAYDSAPSKEAIVGRKVGRSLRNGEAIFTGVLEREKTLRRGDVVKVVFGEDNWRIMMTGIAEEDGFVGDRVRVRNDKSKKLISGVVSADGEVVVE